METNKSDFKSNIADLTKIPPNEFERYFQDWMERDDVARSLQAKLRCDLIKNFNKTNLGKHILSHTITSSAGSTMRLTLSPLVLALNTLVAEFLYAQNCHFTLSVFCTEIPFRNTLPDFETMRRFRFNLEEICEIWQAVTGAKAHKIDLNKNIIQSYETNPNVSLLLLIIKCLIQKDPLDQLKRNAEVQTEEQEKTHKSTSFKASDQRKKSSNGTSKDDNLDHINKYLLTLSEKVIQMTKEFEQFAKQRREMRPRTLKSSRSREYHALNKSLEHITENMKTMVQAKRKNKRLSNIVESIDHLTQQFGKCAQNFDNVTKFLDAKEYKPAVEKTKFIKMKVKENQTETALHEKSYNDWIHEMRNTANGQKFLNRVEISLRKAFTKHLNQLQKETDIKMKHLKSLMKLHYQQKLTKRLLQEPKTNLDEARKTSNSIENKLQQFEKKQTELLQKLHESSLELQEAKLRQDKSATEIEKIKSHEKEVTRSGESIFRPADIEGHSKHTININGAQLECGANIQQQQPKNYYTIIKSDVISKQISTQSAVRDVSKTQEQFLDMAHNIVEQSRSVDQIVYDAKLRIQELENESNQLEQNFQSYLERRKRSEEECVRNQNIPTIWPILSDLCQTTTSARLQQERSKIGILEKAEEDEEFDKELKRLKDTLQQFHKPASDKQETAKSDSSTSSLEVKNAILEAKLKFFEHENIIRKCREQDDELHTGNLLQKELTKCSELPDYFNNTFRQCSISETNIHAEEIDKDRLDYNLESSFMATYDKDKILDEEQNVYLTPTNELKSQRGMNETSISARRELFPKDARLNEKNTARLTSKTNLHNDLILVYEEFINTPIKSQEYELLKSEKINPKARGKNDSTSELIKQSMAKMQQLFEQQSKSQETLRNMVNELQQGKILQKEDSTTSLQLRPHEMLDKSLSATMTSGTTATTATTKPSEETELKKPLNLSRISNTSVPYSLNLSTESDTSIDSIQQELKITEDETPAATKESKQQEMYKINDELSESSDDVAPSPYKKYKQPELNLQTEFGQVNDSPKLPELNLHSPSNDKEIGEIFTESNRTFAPIESKLDESFSSQSTADLEISTGHQNKYAQNLGNDSESDFWA